MPHERGYRHLSRRIPFALLRRQGPALACSFFWTHRPLGAIGVVRSTHRKFPEPCAWLRWPASFFIRTAERAQAAAVCPAHVSKLGALAEGLGLARIKSAGIGSRQWQ